MRETFKELQVLMRRDASATVLRVHGEIDLATVGVFRESLRGAIATGQGDVQLDLSPTRFCDSVGLCALAEAHRILDTAGRVLRVIAASQNEPMFDPAGRSNSTRHPLTAVLPPLVMMNLPSQPVPQSETLVKVAVGVAALAGTAVRSMATSAAASATATDGARRKILRCIANLCGGWGWGVRRPRARRRAGGARGARGVGATEANEPRANRLISGLTA